MTKDVQETIDQPLPDADELLVLASMRMPFGKYQGQLLIDLPEPYVVWFAKKRISGRQARQDAAGCL